MPTIPAHIFWPGMIISLLLFSFGWSATILIATTSDQGPQVIPNYYEKAVEFDPEPGEPNPYLTGSFESDTP